MAIRDLSTLDDLDRVLDGTAERPAIIYKHSLTCGTSAWAFEELAAMASEPLPLDLHMVRVQTARAVSDAIEARLRVRHESPQVLIVDGRTVRWHASHHRVTAANIARALRDLGLSPDQDRPGPV